MNTMKRYPSPLLHLCSDVVLRQDAVEWAIVSGYVNLAHKLSQDLVAILGKVGKPGTGQQPHIVEAHQGIIRRQTAHPES